ncbi:MAG: hypothetical protein HN348_05890 [Proteobacteria bacterium]|nr:hypothetical protein [Pseudomonadota bacterium]
MMRCHTAIGSVATLLSTLCACALIEEEDHWMEQLEPDSPCYTVNILDGVDDSSTEELNLLFDCLNYHDHFTSLQPTVDALDSQTRKSVPVGIELIHAIGALPDAEIDPWAIAGFALDALQAEDRPIDELLNLLLEAIYGVRATLVRNGEIELMSESQLSAGLMAPLGELLPTIAALMLDDDMEAAIWASDLMVHPDTALWIRTFESMVESKDTAIEEPMDRIVPHLGEAIAASRSPNNDIWLGATGDSLRDAMDAFTYGEDPLIVAMGDDTLAVLGDIVVRTNLESTILELHEDQVLQQVLPEARWMAMVDNDVQPIGPGESSSLYSFIRLLAATNEPMECSLDLWVTELKVDLGNVAVAILEVIADMDPAFLQDTSSILSDIIEFPLSEWIFYEVADSGICPTITSEVIDDLHAVEVIQEPEATELLIFFIEFLNDLKYGEQNRIPELADMATTLYEYESIEPIEELIRDLGIQPVVGDVMVLLPVFVEPDQYGLTAGVAPAMDFQDALSLVLWIWEEDNGETGWQKIEPLLLPLADDDDTWVLVGRLGTLLEDEQSQISNILELVPPILAIDPDLEILDQIAPLLGNKKIGKPLLRALETVGFTSELIATAPTAEDPEVPMAFGARLITDGTLDDILTIVDMVLDALGTEFDFGGRRATEAD